MPQFNVVLISLYDLESRPARILHASLKRAGVPVQTIFFKRMNPNNTMDPPTAAELDSLIAAVRERGAALVGISLRSTHFQLAAQITEALKKHTTAYVVWGGIHPTIRPLQSLKHADAVCIGEGEDAIRELAEKMSSGQGPGGILNIWHKQGGGIMRNPMRPLIADLDTVPFADFDEADKCVVEHGGVLPVPGPEQRVQFTIMTSRGCPYNCTYCCNNTLRETYEGMGKYVRRRSVDNVINELVIARKKFTNLKFISFEDDVFTFDTNWLREFSQRYTAEVNLPFFCYCHPRATKEEMVTLLKSAGPGVARVTMGIQSGSEHIRREYFERFDTNEDIIRTAELLHRHGIACAYDVIMDNPLEDDTHRMQTLELLLKLPRSFELHTHTLTHFPETKLTKLLLERGLIQEEDVEDRRQISYTRWAPSLDLGRTNGELFWDNLYYLAKKRHIPAPLVLRLSRGRILRRFPRPLTALLRMTSTYEYTARRGSRFDRARIAALRSVISLVKRAAKH